MPRQLIQEGEISEGGTGLVSIDLEPYLDAGELVATLNSVTAQANGGDLTITNEAVSSAALVILKRTVAIGKAVQFLVAGQLVANTPYTLDVSVTTDSTPAQTEIFEFVLNVV